MTQSAGSSALQVWTVPETLLSVEYLPGIMEEIRAYAMDGFRQLARGGLEMGGVLFGTREENRIRVSAWRAVECQHAKGPSFQLSEDDRRGLGELLQTAKTDPQLSSLESVGWFVSHTRDGITLRDVDVRVFDSFFPRSWQITLVLQPSKDGSMRAGFFFREPDGTVNAHASLREFSLEPASAPTAPAIVTATAPIPVPKPARKASRRDSSSRLWIWILALVMAPIVGWIVMHRPATSKVPASFSFQIVDTGTDIRLQWDKNSGVIRDAVRGMLDIKDSGSIIQLPLEGERLRDGSFTYTRKSGDLEILMTVYPVNGLPVQESARFVGPPANAPAGEDALQIKRERDSLADEVDQLKETLRKQTVRNRELEDLVRILENRLEIEGPRKKP